MDLVLAILLPFAVVFRKLTLEIRRKNGEIMEKKEDSHRFFLDVISKLDFVRGNGFSGETEAIYKRKNGRTLETPQNNIAYSAPENFFMETSVMDNLRAGGEYAAKVRQIPQIRELLKALPEREETVLEEGARNLSGGQRQLLALDRVMAKENARIWILDEPAASLDRESRRQMGELIRQAAKERCVLVITHQEDLLEQMQVSYELRDGRIMRHTGEHS